MKASRLENLSEWTVVAVSTTMMLLHNEHTEETALVEVYPRKKPSVIRRRRGHNIVGIDVDNFNPLGVVNEIQDGEKYDINCVLITYLLNTKYLVLMQYRDVDYGDKEVPVAVRTLNMFSGFLQGQIEVLTQVKGQR